MTYAREGAARVDVTFFVDLFPVDEEERSKVLGKLCTMLSDAGFHPAGAHFIKNLELGRSTPEFEENNGLHIGFPAQEIDSGKPAKSALWRFTSLGHYVIETLEGTLPASVAEKYVEVVESLSPPERAVLETMKRLERSEKLSEAS